MSSMRILPTKVHGALDYIVGIALLLAPTIFGFSAMGGAEVWIPRVLGAVLIVYSIFTNYEWGVIKVLDMRYHLVVDLLASLFLAASPFLFGFVKENTSHWLPHVVVGIAVVVVVLISQTAPGGVMSRQEAPHPA